VGLVLVAACPGGAIANLLSYLMKGNVALSVSFTAINSFITIFTIPIVANIALGTFMDTQSTLVMPFWETMAHIMLITVVPAVLGVWMHGRWPRKTAAMQRSIKVGMPLLLAGAMVGAIFLEKKDVVVAPSELIEVLPWALLLNAMAMAAGWATAALLRLGRPAQVTLGLEVGLHNSGLAIAIATSQFLLNHPTAAVPASTFALFSFFTALVYGWLVNGRALDWREMLGIKRH
jgi:BASS family bile acid:Na+ symporter